MTHDERKFHLLGELKETILLQKSVGFLAQAFGLGELDGRK